MTTITLKGNPIQTNGELPRSGQVVPSFKLVKLDLSEAGLSDFPGRKVLNVFPSVDTPVCATSIRTFNEKAAAAAAGNVTVLNISGIEEFRKSVGIADEGP